MAWTDERGAQYKIKGDIERAGRERGREKKKREKKVIGGRE